EEVMPATSERLRHAAEARSGPPPRRAAHGQGASRACRLRTPFTTASKGDDMATIEKYCAPGVYDTPSYSHAIKGNRAHTILFLPVQVRYAPDGTVNHVGDFMGQARQVFVAVKALVEHAGGTLQNVVKITTYVTDVRRRLDFRVVRDEFFGQRGPASTMV